MIINSANALKELFDVAKDSLSIEKLEWLSDLDGVASCESVHVAAALNYLGSEHGATEEKLLSNYNLACVLFGLSAQVEQIAAMIEISSDAKYLIEKKAEQAAKSQA